MATVLDAVLQWSATRPLWQRDALRRLVTTGAVEDAEVTTYAAACLGEEGGSLEPLLQDHVPASPSDEQPVTILGIHSAINVNSLAHGEHLTFTPEDMTIVYGDNGSGKSGYARILKAVTRTRASEHIHNVKGPETLQPGLTSRNSLSEAHPPWPCPSSTVSSGAPSRPFVSTG